MIDTIRIATKIVTYYHFTSHCVLQEHEIIYVATEKY